MVQSIGLKRVAHCTNIWLLVDSEKSVWVKEYTIQVPECFQIKALEVLGDGRILLLNTFKKGEKGEQNPRPLRYIMQLYDTRRRACTDAIEMSGEFQGPTALYTVSLPKWLEDRVAIISSTPMSIDQASDGF
ncbi:hypothetical protein ACP70R_044078 [Stipagrostis hirtigluma subsp. patula]